MATSTLRVLHLPSAVGGNAWGLAQGERAIGLKSDVLVVSGNRNTIRYPAHREVDLVRWPGPVAKFARLGWEFLRVRNRYDVFHFNFGRTLLHFPHRGIFQGELPYYPKRARLFATVNGCDVRQKDITVRERPTAMCHDAACTGGLCNDGSVDRARRSAAAKMAQFVEHIWALNPDLLRFLPPDKSSFLPYTVAHFDALEPSFSDYGKRRLRIVHAPTDRVKKGTAWILAALETLPPESYELVLVENMTHEQALEIYRSADLVVDQVLSGWYGAVAVEVMRMGKPVIAYLAPEDVGRIEPAMARDLREAIPSASPIELPKVLRQAVEDRAWLKRRAEAAYDFAGKWHEPRRVAAVVRARYEG
jgi:hypothetical protein